MVPYEHPAHDRPKGKASMKGKRSLTVKARDQRLEREFWPVDIHHPCIIRLDLLARWEAVVDKTKTIITIGAATITSTEPVDEWATQTTTSNQLWNSKVSRAAVSHHCSGRGWCGARRSSSSLPLLTPVLRRLRHYLTSGSAAESASTPQQGQRLKENTYIFAARDEDCGCTALVQHPIDMGSSQPNCLRPHHLSLNKRQVLNRMVQEMRSVHVVLVKRKTGRWR